MRPLRFSIASFLLAAPLLAGCTPPPPRSAACPGCNDANVAIWKPVAAQLDAYNAGNIDAFLSVYDPSVVIQDVDTRVVRMRGLEAMRVRYEKMFKGATPPHAEVTNRIISGDFVFDHEKVTIGSKHLEAVAVYRIKNGKIDRVWFSPKTFEPASEPVTALVGGTVVRPENTANPRIDDAVVLIEKGLIKEVGPKSSVTIPKDANVVDVKGKFITAGLVDSHVHFFQSGGLYTRPDSFDMMHKVPYADEAHRIREHLPGTLHSWLASGVTGVVDDGGPMWNFTVRDVATDMPFSPEVKIAGPLISTKDVPQVHRMDLKDPPIIPVKNADEARALAKRELLSSPDYVKVWFLHADGDDLAAQEAMTRAAGDEAHAKGIRLMVHATTLDVAKAALRAGADILVHSVEDKLVDDEFLKLAKERHVIYIPTLYVLQGYATTFAGTWSPTEAEKRIADPETLRSLTSVSAMKTEELPKNFAERRDKLAERAKADLEIAPKNLVKVRDAGITIALGTDAGNIGTVHGPSVFREMAMMRDSGMTPSEVLVSATRGGALVLGEENALGVERGRRADLAVLTIDPSREIPKGTEVVMVVRRGQVMTPSDILDAP